MLGSLQLSRIRHGSAVMTAAYDAQSMGGMIVLKTDLGNELYLAVDFVLNGNAPAVRFPDYNDVNGIAIDFASVGGMAADCHVLLNKFKNMISLRLSQLHLAGGATSL